MNLDDPVSRQKKACIVVASDGSSRKSEGPEVALDEKEE